MKCYRVDYHDPDTGPSTYWAANKEHARVFARDIESDSNPEIWPVDVPTEKRELLRFLNTWANCQEGH